MAEIGVQPERGFVLPTGTVTFLLTDVEGSSRGWEDVPEASTYILTPEGLRVAIFYTKLQDRLLRPLLEADKPPAPPELRRALTTVDRVTRDYITNARLGLAA